MVVGHSAFPLFQHLFAHLFGTVLARGANLQIQTGGILSHPNLFLFIPITRNRKTKLGKKMG
jgi:hypothetical protein